MMSKITVQFKAKVKDGGFFKFPMIDKNHIVEGLNGNGRLMSYSNSSLFKDVINRHLKNMQYPVGLSCIVANLGPELGIAVQEGFLSIFTFSFED